MAASLDIGVQPLALSAKCFYAVSVILIREVEQPNLINKGIGCALCVGWVFHLFIYFISVLIWIHNSGPIAAASGTLTSRIKRNNLS